MVGTESDGGQLLDEFKSTGDVGRAASRFASLSDTGQRRAIEATAEMARDGDPPTLELLLLLVDRHRLAVPSVRRVIADDGLAEEVVQDVLIVVAEQITTFRGDSSFRTWLFGVARNQARHHLRSHLRKPQAAELTPDDERPTARISSIVAQRQDVEAMLATLPEHYRRPVVMRDVDTMTYEAIADTLGIELGTVRSRIARGRALLAARIGP